MVWTLYLVLAKQQFCYFETPNQPWVLLSGLIGISFVNIGETTIESGLAVKPGIRLLGFNYKMKLNLRKKLSEVKIIITDRFQCFQATCFLNWMFRYFQTFMCFTVMESVGSIVLLSPDLLQLNPVMDKSLYIPVNEG